MFLRTFYVIIYLLFVFSILPARTYYIEQDGTALLDTLNGKWSYDMFREAVSARNLRFNAEDEILFKSGVTFTGQLIISGNDGYNNGTAENPVTISSYGTGNKPKITGESSSPFGGVFKMENCEGYKIDGLAFENTGNGISTTSWGVSFTFFDTNNNNTSDNKNYIHIENCVFDTTASNAIYIEKRTKWAGITSELFTVSDIKIENNEIKDCGDIGIFIMDNFCSEDTLYEDIEASYKDYWFEDVVIKKNKVKDIDNNGIVVWGAESPKIQNNIVKKTGRLRFGENESGGGKGQGIFVSYTSDALIEYNEVYDNVYTYYSDLDHGDADAGGIGIDFYSYNTICQYNYLYNNAQNGIAIMANYAYIDTTTKVQNPRPVEGAIVRYNICINNSKKPDILNQASINNIDSSNDYNKALEWWQSRCGEIRISGPVNNCKIYNNVFISSDNAYQMIAETSWYGYPQNIYWSNNIFYSGDNDTIKYEYDGSGNYFNNNCFDTDPDWIVCQNYSYEPETNKQHIKYQVTGVSSPIKTNNIICDPKFKDLNNIDPDRNTDDYINWSDPGFEGLKLSFNSLLIGRGYPVNINDSEFEDDLWGNKAYYNAPDIGINETVHDPLSTTRITNQYINKDLYVDEDGDVIMSGLCGIGSKWVIEQPNEGVEIYRIRSYRNGKYLRYLNDSITCEPLVPEYPSFSWRIYVEGGIWKSIESVNSDNYFLRGYADNSPATCYYFSSGNNEYSSTKWKLVNKVEKLKTLKNKDTGSYICVTDEDDVVRSDSISLGAIWIVEDPWGNGLFRYKNFKTGKYLRYLDSNGEVTCEDITTAYPTYSWKKTQGWGIYECLGNNNYPDSLYLRDNWSNIICEDMSGFPYPYSWSSTQWEIADYNDVESLAGISGDIKEVTSFSLEQNFPNPFNPVTTISYSIPVTQKVKIKVYNIMGREVAELVNKNVNAGVHQVIFNGSHLSSGQYFYKIDTKGFNKVKKMILIK